ncbi:MULTISPECIES: hypothetical protein [unclassified Tolypothrix]|nr:MULTISPECIES: hypothetical protein [unclassified Tolypothrix]EKF04793.1 hypothetical protein FDUTEX481_00951 [Tolypothrix sp. PCC 7601]MBE9081783.1 hypothetical protein [Tolypothrix sp. LEGE 11397]UYD26003.1 hypothetical protein HGR01_32620 [Tolypothrix sp. PCC 7712]UYD31757.1 hypothetical protein HG267_21905 [Tolypothrix sp. PCC 7601]
MATVVEPNNLGAISPEIEINSPRAIATFMKITNEILLNFGQFSAKAI